MEKIFNMPWEDRPEGCTDVMWRYSKNPVIGRYQIPSSNSIFNSAVVPFGDGFAGVFRCDNKAVQMNIFAGFSKDGIHWDINHEPIRFKSMIRALHGSKTVIGLRGVTVITDLRSELHIRSTLKNFFNVRMPFCHLTVMEYCFLKRLMVNMPC